MMQFSVLFLGSFWIHTQPSASEAVWNPWHIVCCPKNTGDSNEQWLTFSHSLDSLHIKVISKWNIKETHNDTYISTVLIKKRMGGWVDGCCHKLFGATVAKEVAQMSTNYGTGGLIELVVEYYEKLSFIHFKGIRHVLVLVLLPQIDTHPEFNNNKIYILKVFWTILHFIFQNWINVWPSDILINKQWTTLGVLTFNWKAFSVIICREKGLSTLKFLGGQSSINVYWRSDWDYGPQCPCQSQI